MSSNLSQTHLLCSHLILVHKILILFHMTWYQNLMHNIVIQLRNSGYSGFGPFLNYSISIFPSSRFWPLFLTFHFTWSYRKWRFRSFTLLCSMRLCSSEKWILKNIYGFSKEKNCAQKGAKIILDMIKGTKRVLSSQELVISTKSNLYIF